MPVPRSAAPRLEQLHPLDIIPDLSPGVGLIKSFGGRGYFVLPVDVIPDLIPGVGYTDDLGLLAGSVVAVAAHIDAEVKVQAAGRLEDWFGSEQD